MFTCAPIKSGETYLSKHLAANDYYSEGEKVLGVWLGKGAELLGMADQEIGPKDEAFERLRTNLHPVTGKPLTPRTSEDRRAFYDFQCSAPKSLSVLAVTYGDERLRMAHEKASKIAFRYLEQYASRRDRAGEKANRDESIFTGNIAAAAFTHDASRALDAQLHTHFVCANATFDQSEGKWYALQNEAMYRASEAAGRVYQNELALLVKSLGYSTVLSIEDGKFKGFEIAGLSASDLEKQSTRRAQIEAEAEKFRAAKGRMPTAGELHVIATSTRNSKLAEITTDEVRAAQLGKYSSADQARLRQLVADARARADPERAAVDPSKLMGAVSLAVESISTRNAVFTRRDVLAHVLREEVGNIDLHGLQTALAAHPSLADLNLSSGAAPIEAAPVSTRENLMREMELVRLVNESVGKYPALAPGYEIGDGLTLDQRVAVERVINCEDGVMAIRGPAGTGKTTTLGELDRIVTAAIKAAEKGGLTPLYVAPSHQAKGVLQRDGFANATTLKLLLVEMETGRADLRGKLVIVDEAGMVSTRDAHALVSGVLAAGGRVLKVGDEKQLSAVEAGDAFAILKKYSKLATVELSTIFRQKENADYLKAMQVMATGNVRGALELLDKQGRIIEGKGDYLANAAASYCEQSKIAASKGETIALVAPTWREIDTLTDYIRAAKKIDGELKGQEITLPVVDVSDLTPADKCRARHYEAGMLIAPTARSFGGLVKGVWSPIKAVTGHKIVLGDGSTFDVREIGRKIELARPKELALQVGDRVLMQGNDKDAGITNGMRAVITGVAGSEIHYAPVINGRAGEPRPLPDHYKTLTHGYAMTVHASQGETVTRVIIAAASLDGKLANVATSRGRRQIEAHVADKKRTLSQAPTKIKDRAAAMDYRLGPVSRSPSVRKAIARRLTYMATAARIAWSMLPPYLTKSLPRSVAVLAAYGRPPKQTKSLTVSS